MILTSQKALLLISNHEVVKVVPELLAPVEAFVAANKLWNQKKDCPRCDRASFFSKVETGAMEALAALPPDAVLRLKKFLNVKELYLNRPVPGKIGGIHRLD